MTDPFTDEAFLSRVQHNLAEHNLTEHGQPDPDQPGDRAIAASIAVLQTVGEKLPVDQAHSLAAHLPPGLRARVSTRPNPHKARPAGGQHAVGPGD